MSSQSLDAQLESAALPQHIAVIMDGNGRWAKARGKARVFGHKAGVKAVRKTVKAASELGVKALTLFAFSSENWRRPEDEVSVLMELFISVLSREVKRLNKNGVQLRVIGDTSRFNPSLQQKIAEAEALTANNDQLVLNIAANYGGQWDITQAARRVAEQVATGQLQVSDITEQDIARQLMLSDLPDVDLMIRTSGECRISNFILWQAAYAELYFTEQYWPDFNEQSLFDAVAWYVNRERRFGCTGEQIKAMLTTDK
ncbi:MULTISPECIES: isoprenyl transferase [Salinivibrio]|uniref:Ditrans,polycis-undecaprenyl-diphosphate synthase ((2E,6E)-farnesyl-diphosphate specific) n=2 Tax=Salinivibrio TaxID=51366 RepID=A0ABY7LGR8_9GAMM|nr:MULTISPECIES: isoprenyl transferase [Salinivibrio]ODQ00152.1 di-trans,poly-cis-decaprenylcistransferase [Salinivibrio sp. DV]PCE69069.1 isoprenyl transferase [Salinivibrio sp. YCSC6]QCF36503.1 isoprenyl transferase [Salinivibrio sp. YCSC6]QIR05518.1 isoprenyl transferase [Salinivibrio costicola]WBA15376.1 isoprenyl transferase [Salinivibrio proteolyticus]